MRLAFIILLLSAGAGQSFGQMRLANPTLNQYPYTYGPQTYYRVGYHMYPAYSFYPSYYPNYSFGSYPYNSYGYGYGYSRPATVNNYYSYNYSINNSFNLNTVVQPARLTVQIPGNGRVWINGVETHSASSETGKFTVKAEIGDKIANRELTVAAGDKTQIIILSP